MSEVVPAHVILISMREMNKWLKQFNEDQDADYQFCWCEEYVDLKDFGRSKAVPIPHDEVVDMLVGAFVPVEYDACYQSAGLYLDRGRKTYLLIGFGKGL